MIATNTIAPISGSLRALVQRIRQETAMEDFKDAHDADVLGRLLELLDQADAILVQLDEAEQHIQSNADLSEAGRTKQMIETVAGIYKQLAFVSKAATDREAAASDLKRKLETLPAPSGDPVVARLDEWEVRERLRGMSQAERMAAYLRATEQGNVAVLRAVEQDPLQELFVPKEYAVRVRQEHLEKTKMKEWRRWQTLRFAMERLQILANSIEFQMAGYGKVPSFPTPPTRQTDLKMQNGQEPPAKSKADAPPSGGVQGLQ